MFKGFVTLGSSFPFTFLTRTTGNNPLNSASLPTYRVYGPSGLMQNGTGSASFKDTGSITGATNASPIVITSTAHGLQTGNIVTITGVGGNTAANGTFTITRVGADTFSLDGSTGNGAYTSGGTWNVSGLYKVSISAIAADGYAAGTTYVVALAGVVNSVNWSQVETFTVT